VSRRPLPTIEAGVPLRKGGGLVDATGGWLVGAKGEYPGSFVHGNMFVGLHEDRFVLRLGEEHVAEARRAGARAFEPMPGRPMKGWYVVPRGGGQRC
jgi:hypothetical protein